MRGAPVYLHIGLMKTGTSYLQGVLRAGSAALAEQGVSMVPHHQIAAHRLSLALRERDFDGERLHAGHQVLERLPDIVEAAPGDRCLLTEESLAFAEPAQVARLGAALAGHELHVVVTVRDIARTVPSAWQQRLKAGRTLAFPDYVEAVVTATGSAGRTFWQGHGAVKVLERWSALAPRERTHVVVVPAPGAAPGALLDRFCSALDVDATTLPEAVSSPNESLGAAQAEVLRRVNELLPEDLRARRRHGEVVKRYLALQVLAPQGGERTRLPGTHRAWALEQAHATVAAVEAAGYTVHGDLADLVPDDASFADRPGASGTSGAPEAPVSDADDVVGAAAAAIVAMLAERAGSAGSTGSAGVS